MPDYPEAPPRRYYRLTDAGRAASDTEWSNPVVTLYPDLFNLEYFREKNKKHRYYKQPKKG
jgi:DNA-binding PadR family transcriptional regulator